MFTGVMLTTRFIPNFTELEDSNDQFILKKATKNITEQINAK